MKSRYLCLVIVLAFLVILVSSCSNKYNHRYNLKLINKFTVPELTKNSNHKVLDGYAVSFALSDSIIYITDTSDTTKTKSFNYDFKGNKKNSFLLPEKTGYWENFNEGSLHYLPQSKELVYNNWQKRRLDFYKLDGRFIEQEKPFKNKREAILSVAEFKRAKYYVTITVSKFIQPTDKNNSEHLHLYKEMPDKSLKEISNLTVKNSVKNQAVAFKEIQIDDNTNGTMATFEDRKFYNYVTVYQPNKIIRFNIIKNKYKGKLGIIHVPYQFNFGENYVVVSTWLPRLEYPLTQKIFNFKGHYIGKLDFPDDNKNELVDIVGDRLVAFNPATSMISIYEIKVK